MTRLAFLSIGVLLCSTLLLADDLSIEYDPAADFSTFKTFELRPGNVSSQRPELDNPIFIKKLGGAIRTALVAKGLKEADHADVAVKYSVSGEDYSVAVRSPGVVAPSGRGGMRGGVIGASGPESRRFTEGTLVIDLMTSGLASPVWRGVYRDEESTGSKLVDKLQQDAAKLIEQYPPKSKR